MKKKKFLKKLVAKKQKIKRHKKRIVKREKRKNNLQLTTEFLKIISEKKRLGILGILKKSGAKKRAWKSSKEMSVLEICKYLNAPQNLISHHLKVLKNLNLLSQRKEGTKVFYKLNKRVVKKYLKILNKFL